MATAKTASKNNPTSRKAAKEYLYEGKKIRPVKLISKNSTFFAAEYEGSGDLVLSATKKPLPWSSAKSLCE